MELKEVFKTLGIPLALVAVIIALLAWAGLTLDQLYVVTASLVGLQLCQALLIDALKDLGALVTWSDPVVGVWHGVESTSLHGADIAIVVTKHDVVASEDILKSAPYVFDTTGKVKGAVQL